MSINKLRGFLILSPVLALILSLAIRNEALSLTLAAACLLAALAFLYRHLAELTDISANNPKLNVLRSVTIFNALLLLAVILFTALSAAGVIPLSENQEAYLACGIVEIFILVLGNIAPKLPFNRHTGLRLPWTVTDEDTWIVAHRILGYLSFPTALCNTIGVLAVRTPQAKATISVCALLLWAGVPSVLSGVFYGKKMKGKI